MRLLENRYHIYSKLYAPSISDYNYSKLKEENLSELVPGFVQTTHKFEEVALDQSGEASKASSSSS
jgi:hypothetical protein